MTPFWQPNIELSRGRTIALNELTKKIKRPRRMVEFRQFIGVGALVLFGLTAYWFLGFIHF